MPSLIRWSPFREMVDLREEVDRLFDNTFRSMERWQPEFLTRDLALDMIEKEGEFEVKASVPGMDPDDLEITLTDNILTIAGEREQEEEREEGRYHLRERRYGKFSRSVSLPAPVKEEEIEATYDKGVLTLHLPKAEEVKPHRITIRPNGHEATTVK